MGLTGYAEHQSTSWLSASPTQFWGMTMPAVQLKVLINERKHVYAMENLSPCLTETGVQNHREEQKFTCQFPETFLLSIKISRAGGISDVIKEVIDVSRIAES